MKKLLSGLFSVLVVCLLTSQLFAPPTPMAIRSLVDNPGFASNTLDRNDDLSTGLVSMGMTLNFFGTNYTDCYVNNNGNISFSGPLWTYTPFNLYTTGIPMLAPFFADVDTRNGASGVTQYGTDTVNGRPAFGVNWFDVGYFSYQVAHLNTFQLVVIDRSDIGIGDFDFEFNYGTITWETGSASGGNPDGLGGYSARAGWSNGYALHSYELTGSAINGALLDGGPNALISGRLSSTIDGRYVFSVRNGQVEPPDDGVIPEPFTATLGIMSLLGVSLAAARRRRA